MTQCQVANLLDKMNSSDKDFRFMATTDLMTELQKSSIKLDDEIERKIVKMLLNLLEDKNGEVQNLAVKCLGPLVSRVKNNHVEYIVDTLCKNMTCDKEQLRDISSIGLKTVIVDLPKSSPELISVVCNNITDKLTDVIRKQSDVPVQLEALDILSDILNRFGNQLTKFYTSIQAALLPLLESQRSAVRKRAITALAHLLSCCEIELFNSTISYLLDRLTEHSQNDFALVPTYIQCIAAVSRLCGQRFGDHLQQIVPFIVQLSSRNDDELKEYCIQVFDAFLRKAPKEITAFVPQISEICLKYLCHDPNYNYDNGEDEEEMELDTEFENEESNDEYSDDDDMSWKVRRASAKCVEALISTRHDMMIELYKNVSPILIQRYKEREENVKVDVFSAYISLLKQTRNCISNYQTSEDSPVQLLKGQVPNIIKTLHKQLKEKSVKTRQGSFNLLLELINVIPGCMEDHLEIIIPGVLYSLNDKNSTSNMKIDTLVFLNALFKTHPAKIFHPYLEQILPAVIASVDDSFYKISSEALVVLTQMIKVIRPSHTDPANTNYIQPIFKCTFSKLQASDLDQEVKERAITCMGQLIHTFGDVMKNDLDTALGILVERLRNEITRLTSIKAFTLIASSSFKINFAPYLDTAIPILAGFLRKNQRTLKISSLILLDTLVKNYATTDITPQVIENILVEIPLLINESDLYISQITLTLLTSLINSDKAYFPIITDKILGETLVLIRSPLLQGTTLQSSLNFFQILVLKSFPNLNFDKLLTSLTTPIYTNDNLHKQAYHSIAKCVSAISTVDNKRALTTVTRFINDTIQYKNQESIQAFALLTIGEIGKRVDLSSIGQLKELLISALGSPSEEVKSAASFALGSISVGNLKIYLPFVLSEIEKRDKKQYLLLHSLKEIISCQLTDSTMIQTLNPYLESIWSLLINHCKCPEEGTRNVVAECLGKLINMNPTELLPKLQSYLTHESPHARSTVVTAMKFTISEQPQSIDPLLKECIGDFLKTLEDQDLNVRRVALVAFNSAAHNKPSLVRNLLDQILPQLYKETKVNKSLIREVEMGPFKHTVDDGLDLRKAAFECMYTLLDSCLDRIDIFEFLNHVESGLKDHSDIKMLTYLMLIRLSTLHPTAVLNRIDSLIEPLKSICISKVKSNAVKQENEKFLELKRSALRAFLSLVGIPDADKNSSVVEFLNIIKTNEELQALYDQVQNDNVSMVIGDTQSSMMEVN